MKRPDDPDEQEAGRLIELVVDFRTHCMRNGLTVMPETIALDAAMREWVEAAAVAVRNLGAVFNESLVPLLRTTPTQVD